jgi:hypothetical protein
MGGGGKGGSADSSGMMEAMASAQAAQQAYALGEQQLQWSEQVWNQQEPTVIAAANAQMALEKQQAASMQQATNEAAQQWGTYEQNYLPEELKLIGQVNDWASPGNQALVRGEAMGDIATQGQAGINTAAETLREYGVNPSSPKYASLYAEAQPMLGAAQAAAGTTASQNLKLQQLGLESGVVNTGRGLVNATGALTTAGTQAGAAGASAASGAGNTLDSSLTAGSNANANATQFFNAGSNAMNTYVNAVNGYNNSQAEFAQAGASEMQGLGSAAGGVLGLLKIAKGGPITKYADGGGVAMAAGGVSPGVTPAVPGISGIPNWGSGAMPAWGAMAQSNWNGNSTPPGATPGGSVPIHASPSFGVVTDDVPAMLTAHEFVIPKDVATWKGHEFYAKHIDQARKAQQAFANRDDIGGETAPGIPQQPTFVSRPDHHGGAMGGWEAALNGGQWDQGASGGTPDWQTALQGFESKLPQGVQDKIQNFETNYPGGWPPQGGAQGAQDWQTIKQNFEDNPSGGGWSGGFPTG